MLNVLPLIGSFALAQSPSEYVIGPSDVLHVEVYDAAALSGDYVVNSAGDLSFPYCGPVRVGNLTVVQAEEALRGCLLDGVLVHPQVNVSIQDFRSKKVEVRGAVNKPAAYYLEGPTTLRAILGIAGDVQLEKSSGAVTIVRGDQRLSVPCDDLDGPQGAMQVEPGDVVLVEQGAVVLVGGQVSKPGPVTFTEGLTVTEALVRAGDATDFANLAASYVLRNGDKISVNLRKMRKGRGADFVLQPGDALVVPESPL